MPEFLVEFFAFRSGVPFGYLGHLVIILGTVIYGVIQIVKFSVPRWRGEARPVIGALLLWYAFLSSWANSEMSEFDFNNNDVGIADIIGTWRDGESTLELKSDQTFVAEFKEPGQSLRIGFPNGHGTWELKASNVHLLNDDGKKAVPLRVVKFRNLYRLIIDDFGDPDLWDGKFGFRRG